MPVSSFLNLIFVSRFLVKVSLYIRSLSSFEEFVTFERKSASINQLLNSAIHWINQLELLALMYGLKNKIFAGERTRYSLVNVTPVWVSCLRYFCVARKPTLEQKQRKCLFKTRLLSRSEVLRYCSKSITSVRLANHPTWLESRENSPFAFVCVCVCVLTSYRS